VLQLSLVRRDTAFGLSFIARRQSAGSFFSKIAEELIAAQASYFKQPRWNSRSTSLLSPFSIPFVSRS
jgi:hypothetical protein